MIRRGDIRDIALVFAWLEMKCLITNQRETTLIIYVSVLSQLSVLVSHKPNLGICSPGTWELSLTPLGRCHFFSNPCLFGCIFQENVPIETFHISS